MIKIENKCALQWLKEQPNFSADLIYCDPPYALGSEIIIRSDGKLDYKDARDFMAKWEMPDGYFWEEFYKECMRVLKHGGHLCMFGIDRQLTLFGYYSVLAGFTTKQSIYWYFISNFPKASDLSKMIDKNAGADREVTQEKKTEYKTNNTSPFDQRSSKDRERKDKPTTNLAKKYNGFKYSVAPLKQVLETLMVFQKPYKTGSALHDVLAYENGDNECSVGALDIGNNRVKFQSEDDKKDACSLRPNSKNHKQKRIVNILSDDYSQIERANPNGRFPSQLFIDPEMAKVLDGQSGVLGNAGNKHDAKQHGGGVFGGGKISVEQVYQDTGGASKILTKCQYEAADFDLLVYEPKVSSSERSAGCENLEVKTLAQSNQAKAELKRGNNDFEGNEGNGSLNKIKKLTNNHPTLKPINLVYSTSKLFKTPNEQTVLVPFSGAGSELIGLFKAGFENIKGCELNPEYVEIAKARVLHNCTDLFNQNVLE